MSCHTNLDQNAIGQLVEQLIAQGWAPGIAPLHGRPSGMLRPPQMRVKTVKDPDRPGLVGRAPTCVTARPAENRRIPQIAVGRRSCCLRKLRGPGRTHLASHTDPRVFAMSRNPPFASLAKDGGSAMDEPRSFWNSFCSGLHARVRLFWNCPF